MLFNVHVVSEDEYDAYLKTLVARGQTGEAKGAAIPNPVGEPGNTSEATPSPLPHSREARDDDAAAHRHRREIAAPEAAAGHDLVEVDGHHRPQGDRQPLLHHLDGCSSSSAASWRSASAPSWPSRACSTCRTRDVQPVLHHARHDHAAAVRDPAVRRLRQRDHAAADRLARRRVPAAEHAVVLALPVRWPRHGLRLPVAVGRGQLRLVRVRPAQRRGELARRRWRPVDHGPLHGRSGHDPRRGQLHHHDHHACGRPA